MAPPQVQTSETSTAPQSDSLCRPLRRLQRWGSKYMQGTVSQFLFAMGFLINSVALCSLFILLKTDFKKMDKTGSANDIHACTSSPGIYLLSIDITCPYFILLSFVVFCVMISMQCRSYNESDKSTYKSISILGGATFVFSIFLIVISSMGIMMENDSCGYQSPRGTDKNVLELKLRYMFQATASFVTSVIYTIIGVSLLKRGNPSTVNPSPSTPIYQISPPEFDTLFPPPPTYQQSQMHHQQRLGQSN